MGEEEGTEEEAGQVSETERIWRCSDFCEFGPRRVGRGPGLLCLVSEG